MKREAVVASILFAIVAAALLLAVPVRATRYLWETFIAMEGGWRLVQGMRIGDEMRSPLGPGYFAPIAGAIRVVGRDAHALTWVGFGFALLAGPLTGGIVAHRVGGRWPLLAALAMTALCLAPTCLGDPEGRVLSIPFESTYGMQYNRVLWALAGPAAFALVVPGRRESVAEALLIGLVFGWAFVTKANYAIAALPLAAFGWVRRDRSRWFLLRGAIGASIGIAAFLPFVDPLGYVEDLRRVGASQSPGILLKSVLSRIARHGEFYVAAGVVFGALRFRVPTGARADFFAAGLLWGYGIFVSAVNYQHTGAPVFAFGLLTIAIALARESAPSRSVRISRAAAGLAFGASLLSDVIGIAVPVVAEATGEREVGPRKAPPLIARMRLPATEPMLTVTGATRSVAFFRFLPRPMTIYVLQDHNFLPVLMGWPSPGGTLWFDEGHVSALATMPDFEREFRGSEAVFLPLVRDDRVLPLPDRAYRTRVLREFPRVLVRDPVGNEIRGR